MYFNYIKFYDMIATDNILGCGEISQCSIHILFGRKRYEL